MAVLFQGGVLTAQLLQQPLAQLLIGRQQLVQFGQLGSGGLGLAALAASLGHGGALAQAGESVGARGLPGAFAAAGFDGALVQGGQLAEADGLRHADGTGCAGA